MRNSILPNDLRAKLLYDPESGIFKWITSGKPAGYLRSCDGYIQIGFSGYGYLAHRLIWLYQYGRWPSLDIDHINGNRADNRLINLREITRQGNLENIRKPRKDNSTGFLGVSRTKEGRFRARICVNGVQKQLGEFKTPDEAAECYWEAKQMLHRGFVSTSEG